MLSRIRPKTRQATTNDCWKRPNKRFICVSVDLIFRWVSNNLFSWELSRAKVKHGHNVCVCVRHSLFEQTTAAKKAQIFCSIFCRSEKLATVDKQWNAWHLIVVVDAVDAVVVVVVTGAAIIFPSKRNFGDGPTKPILFRLLNILSANRHEHFSNEEKTQNTDKSTVGHPIGKRSCNYMKWWCFWASFLIEIVATSLYPQVIISVLIFLNEFLCRRIVFLRWQRKPELRETCCRRRSFHISRIYIFLSFCAFAHAHTNETENAKIDQRRQCMARNRRPKIYDSEEWWKRSAKKCVEESRGFEAPAEPNWTDRNERDSDDDWTRKMVRNRKSEELNKCRIYNKIYIFVCVFFFSSFSSAKRKTMRRFLFYSRILRSTTDSWKMFQLASGDDVDRSSRWIRQKETKQNAAFWSSFNKNKRQNEQTKKNGEEKIAASMCRIRRVTKRRSKAEKKKI